MSNLTRFLETLRPILVSQNGELKVAQHWPRIAEAVRGLEYFAPGLPLRSGIVLTCARLGIPPTPEAVVAYLTMPPVAS